MLIFAKFMENSLFHGSIVVWYLIIPFIFLINFHESSYGIEVITRDYVDIKTGDDIAK